MTEENKNNSQEQELTEEQLAQMTQEEREEYEFKKRLEELRKRDPFIYR
jgi:hypothetical protein